MTECREGCGACCQPVSLPHNRTEIEMMPPVGLGGAMDPYTRWWALHVLVPITAKEAFELAPWKRGSTAMPLVRGKFLPHPSSFYVCQWFDQETRRCGQYDLRPDLCRRYPRGDRERVEESKALPPMCSFRVDQGKEVEPLPEWRPVELVRKS